MGDPSRFALTRPVGSGIVGCELTFLDRSPIDPVRARAQHEAYEHALAAAGWRVQRVPAAPGHPDGVFVEDAVVMLDEVAVLARPGAASRRGEVASVEAALRDLAPDLEIRRIAAPGTLDGGDVLPIGRTLWVGVGHRTNAEGVRQLAAAAEAGGYRVRPVTAEGCLHLKTAVTAAADDLLIANPAWIDTSAFTPCEVVAVHADEPFAANVLRLGDLVLLAAGSPRTRDRLDQRLRARGASTVEVAMDELAKAEAGVTCCSVLVGARPQSPESSAPGRKATG
jgi:dimethylargininase